MEINNNDGRAKVIAYYLPQFYPFEFNDKWYGKGFTEWTNVGKAKPLFHGHYQPKVPADLGYYDLRLPETAEKQAALAQEAGIFGFAYWHYWWAGKRLLNMPAERMLETMRPNFPFMFAWANESWYKKLWDTDTKKDTLIMEQTYPGEDDNRMHFEYCLPFFKDKRYITFDGRPVFFIYKPLKFKAVQDFMAQWNSWVREEGVADSFYWMAMSENKNEEYELIKSTGFNCVNFMHTGCRMGAPVEKDDMKHMFYSMKIRFNNLIRRPLIFDYRKIVNSVWIEHFDRREDVAPVLIPNWDHTARSGTKGFVFKNSTPERFEAMAMKVLGKVREKENKIVMLKSWNEWAEGNYMEPDLKYGHGYIEALRKAVEANAK